MEIRMMEESKRSVEFAKKRLQAQSNVINHISSILFNCASKVIAESKRYIVAGRITNESSLLSTAKRITAEAEESINGYIAAYSKAACKSLGIDTENIESFLISDFYGKTMAERNMAYLANFAEDVVRMIKAGVMLGYNDQQILSAIRTGYKDPYRTSVITKAQRKDINIATPSYGKGVFKSAYQNIARNARQMIATAWGLAEQEYGKKEKAVGFIVKRGSNYPCDICQSEADAGLHSFKDPYPPYHINCLCYTVFIFNKKQSK